MRLILRALVALFVSFYSLHSFGDSAQDSSASSHKNSSFLYIGGRVGTHSTPDYLTRTGYNDDSVTSLGVTGSWLFNFGGSNFYAGPSLSYTTWEWEADDFRGEDVTATVKDLSYGINAGFQIKQNSVSRRLVMLKLERASLDNEISINSCSQSICDINNITSSASTISLEIGQFSRRSGLGGILGLKHYMSTHERYDINELYFALVYSF